MWFMREDSSPINLGPFLSEIGWRGQRFLPAHIVQAASYHSVAVTGPFDATPNVDDSAATRAWY
jgi:hypothetical protein